MSYLFELLADEVERFEDGLGRTGDGDDALRARTVRDVDAGC